MAKKRRKLNKRVAIVLGCIGALVIALGVTTALTGNWLDRLFPKDPFAMMEQARKFVKEGNRQKADGAFKSAATAGASAKSPKMASFYTEISKFNYDWAMDGNGLTETQRRDRFGQSIALARKAMLMDAKYLPAQQFLADVYWNLNVHSGSGQGQDWNAFIKEADALIKLQPNDAETYFRRGSAKGELIDPTYPGELAKEARNDFEKAIEIKPKEPRYWLGLIGHLDRLRGNEVQIEKAFQDAQKRVESIEEHKRMLYAKSVMMPETGSYVLPGGAVEANARISRMEKLRMEAMRAQQKEMSSGDINNPDQGEQS